MTYDHIIIGAGIAGCSAAALLAERGKQVLLLDAGEIAGGASGNTAGALYPHLTASPSPSARIHLAALDYTTAWLQRVAPEYWHPCGMLLLAKTPDDIVRLEKISALYPQHTRLLSTTEAKALTGVPLDEAGLFLPQSGWLHPLQLCRKLLSAPNITIKTHTRVENIQRTGHSWRVQSSEGTSVCQQLILASGWQTGDFLPLRLTPVRGQMAVIQTNTVSQTLQTVVCRKHYILPAHDGGHVVGSTYQRGSSDATVRTTESLQIARDAQHTLPCLPADMRVLSARAAVRAATPDSLPLAGYVDDILVLTGFGSRGLLTAPFAAALVLEEIENLEATARLSPQRY